MFSFFKKLASSEAQSETQAVMTAFQSLLDHPQKLDAFSALSMASRCESDELRQSNVQIFAQLHGLPAFAELGPVLHADNFLPYALRLRDDKVSIKRAYLKDVSVVFADLASPQLGMRHIHAVVRQHGPARLELVSFEAPKSEANPRAVAERIGRIAYPRALDKLLIPQA